VRTGEAVTIVRAAPPTLYFPTTTHMSQAFRIECGDHTCHPRDLKSSNGTLLNGQGAAIALLRNGGHGLAGNTSFSVQTAQETDPNGLRPPLPPRERTRPHKIAYCPCRNEFQPLYALSIAAVEPSVLKVLLARPRKPVPVLLPQAFPVRSLPLRSFSIVRLSEGRRLLLETTGCSQGWGKNWCGIYLTCDQPIETLRQHLSPFPHGADAGRKTGLFPLLRSPRACGLSAHLYDSKRTAQIFVANPKLLARKMKMERKTR